MDYPDLDVCIEADISPSKVDRPGIYAVQQVAEVWRFEGQSVGVVFERLAGGGTYERIDQSGFIPVRAEEVLRWVIQEDSRDGSQWARRLRAELVPRIPR